MDGDRRDKLYKLYCTVTAKCRKDRADRAVNTTLTERTHAIEAPVDLSTFSATGWARLCHSGASHVKHGLLTLLL